MGDRAAFQNMSFEEQLVFINAIYSYQFGCIMSFSENSETGIKYRLLPCFDECESHYKYSFEQCKKMTHEQRVTILKGQLKNIRNGIKILESTLGEKLKDEQN